MTRDSQRVPNYFRAEDLPRILHEVMLNLANGDGDPESSHSVFTTVAMVRLRNAPVTKVCDHHLQPSRKAQKGCMSGRGRSR